MTMIQTHSALDRNIGESYSCRGSRLVQVSCVAIPVCKVCSPQVHLYVEHCLTYVRI